MEGRGAKEVCEGVYLLKEWVDGREEEEILSRLDERQGKWERLRGRRTQVYGGKMIGNRLVKEKMPSFIVPIKSRCEETMGSLLKGGEINHVLVNEYMEGGGIMAHKDGPAYLPCVSVLSLGCECVFRFFTEGASKANWPVLSVVLPPRSLLIFKGQAYQQWTHQIDEKILELLDSSVANPEDASSESTEDGERCLVRGERRVSLTLRRVLKESRALKFG